VGVELSPSRARIAFRAIRALHELLDEAASGCAAAQSDDPDDGVGVSCPGISMTLSEKYASLQVRLEGATRRLEMHCADLFDFPESFYARADIVIMATDFPKSVWRTIRTVLVHLLPGTRLLTYHDLIPDVWPNLEECPFEWIARNDTFPTSWSQGFPFILWRRKPHPTHRK